MHDTKMRWFVEDPGDSERLPDELIAPPVKLRRGRFGLILATLVGAGGLALVTFALATVAAPTPATVSAKAPAHATSSSDSNFPAPAPPPAPPPPHAPVVVPAPAPAVAHLALVTTPPSARVTLDGVRSLPHESAIAIAPGAHSIVVAHAGFEPATLHIVAAPGELVVRRITLRRSPPATLFVNVHDRGEPSWAHLFVDGTTRGTTPTTLRLAAGDHELRFEKAGRQTISRTISLKPGEQKRLSINWENK